MIFVLPLSLELSEVMRLWLKNPPPYAVGLCYCAMVHHLVNTCTVGHMVAINATGRIAAYHTVLASINIFTVPISVIVGIVWRNVYAVMSVVVVFEALNSIGRLIFARNIAGTRIQIWIREVFLPLLVVISLSVCVGVLPRVFFDNSFGRICLTTVVCEILFLPLGWFFVLSRAERKFLREKLMARISVFVRKK
jgi:hypothetical protein